MQFRRVSCEGGFKCRDVAEPDQIQKCRGLCLNSDFGSDNISINSNSLPTTLTVDPFLNNDIIHLLLPSTATAKNIEDNRPDFSIEDKIQPESLKIMEMQFVTVDPLNSSDIVSNDIEVSDEANQGHTYKKMSVHIGEDAALFLAKINVQSDQPGEPSLDVSKIKPTFKWKIGLWTRVS